MEPLGRWRAAISGAAEDEAPAADEAAPEGGAAVVEEDGPAAAAPEHEEEAAAVLEIGAGEAEPRRPAREDMHALTSMRRRKGDSLRVEKRSV